MSKKRGVVRACRPCKSKHAQWVCRHCGVHCCIHRCTYADAATGTACCQKCWRRGSVAR